MSYKIQATVLFEKQLKRLAKKFPSLKAEFASVIEILEKEPESGTPLGNNCFKIRLAIASKGKSGGARVITHVQVVATTVYLLSIYDKSELSDISDKDLKEWLRSLP